MQKKSTKRTPKKKAATPHASALTVMNFMNSGLPPDFLVNAVMRTIDQACDYVGFARLMYEPGTEGDDLRLLANLVRRTQARNVTDNDLEQSQAGLARHIAAIMDHPETPNDLHSAIADCVTHYTNIQDSDGDSLLDRWTYHPDTITACLKYAKEAEDKKEAAEQLEMRTVRRGPEVRA